jgi:hypothetical protein
MFTDVHPEARINARLFTRLFEMLSETTLPVDEQQRVVYKSMLLIVNKLATTWKHLARYQGIEANRLEAARKTPLERPDPNHHPELYRAFDDFLVQLMDGLSRLWRFPIEFFPEWPLKAMPESIAEAVPTIRKLVEEKQAKSVRLLVDDLERNRTWMELVRSLVVDGIDPRGFRVFVLGPESGDPREVIPMWSPTESISKLMTILWENFYLASELVIGASITHRLRPEVAVVYNFQPVFAENSPWTVIKPRRRLAPQSGDLGAVREALTLERSGKPMLQVEFMGERFRVVGSQIIRRPLKETFHEFLWGLLRTTLGDDWWKAEESRPEPERHQIKRWFEALVRWKQEGSRENKIEGGWRAIPSGDVQALTALAYDIYTLRHAGSLPPKLVERLADRTEFQGAKYEIAVAAMLIRADFKLEFLQGSGKHCEFLAQHSSGLRLGVEAKSRRRPGVLHEKGELDELKAARGDVQSLFDKAKQQKPAGLAFVIFIDVNTPIDSSVPPIESPWLKDFSEVLTTHEATAGERPDPFNALIVTNFSTHYLGAEPIGSRGTVLVIPAKRPEDPLPEAVLDEITAATIRYGTIPEDLERFEEKASASAHDSSTTTEVPEAGSS